ncbi:MAG: cytochrome c, partial [Tepidisphaeraceae bacterium]
TGEKLRVDWMSKFLAGQIKYKPRPWIKARMPAFASRAQWLAEGLAAEHGVSPEDPAPRQPDAELARVGRKLLGRDGGFSCISCHAVADVPALSPFEAPAPNFIYTTARLRKDYYDRWMRAPLKVEPGTRMPQFTDIEGKSSLKQPFDGDANKQFDAMWEYLLSGADIRPP